MSDPSKPPVVPAPLPEEVEEQAFKAAREAVAMAGAGDAETWEHNTALLMPIFRDLLRPLVEKIEALNYTSDKQTVAWKERALKAEERLAQAEAWISDLQSAMYVNCVYCGHRYGPGETTPVSMADALKAHVEQCPKHPMSALKTRLSAAKEVIAGLVEPLQAMCRAWDDPTSQVFELGARAKADEALDAAERWKTGKEGK